MKRNLNEILFGLMLAWAGINCSDTGFNVDEGDVLERSEPGVGSKRLGIDDSQVGSGSSVDKKSFKVNKMALSYICQTNTFECKKRHKCPDCSAGFLYLSRLEMHKERVHVGEKRHTCPDCHARFFAIYELERHKERVHVREKRHECPDCHARFFVAYELERHKERVHGDEKGHKCDVDGCLFKYTSVDDLNSHKKRIHKIGIERLVCPYCYGKTYADVLGLNIHIGKKHKGFNFAQVSVSAEREIFRCMRCNSTFDTAEQELAHKETCGLEAI